jgi:hypothetical protein
MKLMHNFQNLAFLTTQAGRDGDIPPSLYYKHALEVPYIMHECLAASALHMATTEPEASTFYREYAAGLQNKALSLFHEAHPVLDVTAENCEHMFLWSSLVGVHVLGEVFVFQRESLKAFMVTFTDGLGLYRGVLTVVNQCKDMLFATETGVYVERSGKLSRSTVSKDGPECEHLKHMLENTAISPSTFQHCLAATLELQHTFNVQRNIEGDHIAIPVIFAWPILITPEFIQLLRELHPQALIIFAQFAVLLHRARNLWLVGDVGRFLIRATAEYVGPEYYQYLTESLAELQDTLVEED